jgi:hypothetical protein
MTREEMLERAFNVLMDGLNPFGAASFVWDKEVTGHQVHQLRQDLAYGAAMVSAALAEPEGPMARVLQYLETEERTER